MKSVAYFRFCFIPTLIFVESFAAMKAWWKGSPQHHTSLKAWCYVCVLCFTYALEKFNLVIWPQTLFLRHSWSTWVFGANFGRALHGSFRVMAAFVPPSDTWQSYAELLRWVAFCSLLLSSDCSLLYGFTSSLLFQAVSWGTGFYRWCFGNLMFLLLGNWIAFPNSSILVTLFQTALECSSVLGFTADLQIH